MPIWARNCCSQVNKGRGEARSGGASSGKLSFFFILTQYQAVAQFFINLENPFKQNHKGPQRNLCHRPPHELSMGTTLFENTVAIGQKNVPLMAGYPGVSYLQKRLVAGHTWCHYLLPKGPCHYVIFPLQRTDTCHNCACPVTVLNGVPDLDNS